MLASEDSSADPVGDHGVLGLPPRELGHTFLPGLLIPGLAWALKAAHDDGGVGPCCVLERLLYAAARGSCGPAEASANVLEGIQEWMNNSNCRLEHTMLCNGSDLLLQRRLGFDTIWKNKIKNTAAAV